MGTIPAQNSPPQGLLFTKSGHTLHYPVVGPLCHMGCSFNIKKHILSSIKTLPESFKEIVRPGCCNSLSKHTREGGCSVIHLHSDQEAEIAPLVVLRTVNDSTNKLVCDAVLAPSSSHGLHQPPLLHEGMQTPQF